MNTGVGLKLEMGIGRSRNSGVTIIFAPPR